jgi:YVTN family beta-propeller protein
MAAIIVTAAVVAIEAGSGSPSPKPTTSGGPPSGATRLPQQPALGAPLHTNIYAAAGAGMLSPAVGAARYLIYVPNSDDSSVDVIDPATDKVVDHFGVGKNPQHVVPSWDLQTLYATNDLSNSLTPIDPKTGRPAGPTIPVDDPYNMYFTPDGHSAIVVAEAHRHLDFRDPHTFALQRRVAVACSGVDHMDFAADGSYLIASCEFSGQLVKVDLASYAVSYLLIGGMPQDVKVDPAGKVFYVADMAQGGLHEVDGDHFTQIGFLPTGPEAHGLYPSRDARLLYVSNRGGPKGHGSVSVVDFATRAVVANWVIPAPSTPDMGGVSPDGKVLWLSGRRNREVYAIDTATGVLIARIKVGPGPHGLCVWPQPGRYSLGHTGIMR